MHPWCFWVAALAHLLKTLRRPAAVIVYPLADRRPRFSTRGVNAMVGVRRDRDGSRLATIEDQSQQRLELLRTLIGLILAIAGDQEGPRSWWLRLGRPERHRGKTIPGIDIAWLC